MLSEAIHGTLKGTGHGHSARNLYVKLVQGLLDFLSHAGALPQALFAKHCQANANFLRKHFVRSLSFLVGRFVLDCVYTSFIGELYFIIIFVAECFYYYYIKNVLR